MKIEKYCEERGITFSQYERQYFYAERGYGEYPEPQKENPERPIERNIEPEIKR